MYGMILIELNLQLTQKSNAIETTCIYVHAKDMRQSASWKGNRSGFIKYFLKPIHLKHINLHYLN